jgi:hypothetical protein
MLWAAGQPWARVYYELEEYERVPLSAVAGPSPARATDRLIQGSVRQLVDSALVEQEEVVLHLATGEALALRVVRLARRAYGRPVYTVRYPLA